MMSKDQANAVAEVLIAEANRARVTKIPSVPWYLRRSELSVLEPRQRLEVVKQAQRSAARNPWLRGSLAVYVVLCILLWPRRDEDLYHGLSIFSPLAIRGFFLFANPLWRAGKRQGFLSNFVMNEYIQLASPHRRFAV
jgi:hypothetical protein